MMKSIFVTYQREGIHKYPGAANLPGVEFLASPHRHMFHFKITLQVYHDDREVEFILFKRELEKQYDNGTLQLDYKSCEMMQMILQAILYHIILVATLRLRLVKMVKMVQFVSMKKIQIYRKQTCLTLWRKIMRRMNWS